MNGKNVKKVLLIVVVLGVVFAIANWQMKKQGSSPNSTTPPAAGGILNKIFNTGKTTPPTPKPVQPASPAITGVVTPTIDPIYLNKAVQPSPTRYDKFQISIPAGGYIQHLVVAAPVSFDAPTLTAVGQSMISQKSWKDNLFNYIGTDSPSGTYNVELTTPGDVSLRFSCATKDRTATCTIQPTK